MHDMKPRKAGISDWLNLIRLRAFFAGNFDEFYRLAFDKRAVALSDDGLIMNEKVFTRVAFDKAVTFGTVKPFYGACLCF
jgi:hypothetical protein